jgi:glucose-6-phosphate-specific signal transduction histidine kinase
MNFLDRSVDPAATPAVDAGVMTQTLFSSDAQANTAAGRRAAFRPILILLGAFLVVSIAMEVLLIVLTATGTAVDIAVWIRCSLVLGSSIVLLIFAISASRGSRPSWQRLRLVSAIVVAAVIVIVSIPGFLPDWVRIEQAICGAFVLPAVILMNLRRTRDLFPKDA